MQRFLIIILIIISMSSLISCGEKTSIDNQRIQSSNYNKEMNNEVYDRFVTLAEASMISGNIIENDNATMYELGDINIIMSEKDEKTLYYVYIDDEVVCFFERKTPTYEGISAIYVDVTKDGSEDIVIVGEPPRGTLTGPYWTFIYDVKNNKEINIFDESGALTDQQLSEIQLCLHEDFYNIFLNFGGVETCKQWGKATVDQFGNLYYETSFSKMNSQINIGHFFVFFTYDISNKEFKVDSVIYRDNQ